MGYDRGSEPRRSLSGGRSRNYVPRRSARGDYRSPDRPYRGADYSRRAYRNRSPDYSDKYRRRSPSGARCGRDLRQYKSGRNAPYRHSRSRSPLPRRSRSAESVHRNERYTRNDAPSARFGSRASYLRSREVNRALSRSPSRAGRRKSPLRGEQAGRRDVSQRSESRGRYRERHDDRNRNYISPGTDPRKGRGVDQYDPPSNKLDTRRTDKYAPTRRSEDRSVSQHSRSRRPSPRTPRGSKASHPRQRSRSQGRNSKWSRSASRSGSWARARRATATSRRSPINESRPSRRSGSGDRCAETANASRHSQVPEGSLTRRSPVGCRRRENETVERAARHSPDHDKGTRRLSPGESTMKIDGALRRPSRSIDRSHQAYQSESREMVAVEASKHSNQAEVPSRSRSLCRSADCPTPDLVSSRAFKTDSREANSARPSLGPQEKLASEQETSPKRSDDNTSRERCADEAPAVAPRLTSEACAGVRQSPSASRSPSVRTGVPEGERHEGKEHEPSCPAAPLATEQPAPEKSTHLPEATAVSRGPGVCVQKGCAQEGELVQAQDELPTKVEEQPPPSVTQRDHCSPTQRHEERRLSEGPGLDDERQCDGRPVETPGANNMAPTAINCSRTTDELGTQRVRLPSEEIWRNAEADRIPVKRRIVTTEPITPLESAEAFRAYRGPSPRAYSRNQGFLRERGHRFLPGMNRFQPIGPTAWNRLDRDERFDFPQPLHPMSTGRSVRLVARRGDRNLLLPGQQYPRNANPYESQRVQLHNGIFEHSGPPNQRLFKRTPIHIQPAAERNRKTAGFVGRGLQERRNAAAASNADGKWTHDLFEQLSSEPERKRRRFNLYGETLERVED